MSWAPRPLLAALLLFAVPSPAVGGRPPDGSPRLVNGDFSAWENGAPHGWTLGVGARGSRTGPESVVRPGEKEGIALEVARGTSVWRIVSQTVALGADAASRVSFAARATVRRPDEGSDLGVRYLNAYVSVTVLDAAEHFVWRQFESVLSHDWVPYEIVFRANGGTKATVAIFLSQPGTLEVRSIDMVALTPAQSFDVLERQLSRYYSYFDWKGIGEGFGSRFETRGRAAKDEDQFVAVAREMLGELRDPHVWIQRSDGRIVPTWDPEIPRNYSFAAVSRLLEAPRQIGRIALVGTVPPDVGYLAVGSLKADDASWKRVLDAAEDLLDRKGILLDLRANEGGDETRAQGIAALFADQPRVYAKSKVRTGPLHTDLSDLFERWEKPREGKRFAGPVVVLIGPGCMSSGEGFVKMMRVLPNVTLVGQPTRGASGNPQPVDLPNGVSVWFSRWVDMLPDGTIVEGKGVPPDVLVKHEGEGDPTFRAALETLRAKMGKETPR